MKLIVTGCTGLVGGEILAQALRHPGVTSVVALTRRQLPAHLAAHDKLTTVLMDDFEQYPEEVVKKLEGAEACAWALGLARPGDLDTYRKINVTFLQKGIETLNEKVLGSMPSGSKFRLAYVSGTVASRDPEKSKNLWFLAEPRRIRGESETLVLEACKTNEKFEAFVFRPGIVIAPDTTTGFLAGMMGGRNYAIKVEELAGAILNKTVTGGGESILDNATITDVGREELSRKSATRKAG